MASDPDTGDEVRIAHSIMNRFRYTYGDKWVPQKALFQKSRKHVLVFNRLVREGFIERRKTFSGYQYKWKAQMP